MIRSLLRRLIAALSRSLIANTPLAPLAWFLPDMLRQLLSKLRPQPAEQKLS